MYTRYITAEEESISKRKSYCAHKNLTFFEIQKFSSSLIEVPGKINFSRVYKLMYTYYIYLIYLSSWLVWPCKQRLVVYQAAVVAALQYASPNLTMNLFS